uniref:Uncharacterized protein n=1 Tax=Arundo donax TaxID=35708 RepID=A0A0A9GRF8_ARUDO
MNSFFIRVTSYDLPYFFLMRFARSNPLNLASSGPTRRSKSSLDNPDPAELPPSFLL